MTTPTNGWDRVYMVPERLDFDIFGPSLRRLHGLGGGGLGFTFVLQKPIIFLGWGGASAPIAPPLYPPLCINQIGYLYVCGHVKDVHVFRVYIWQEWRCFTHSIPFISQLERGIHLISCPCHIVMVHAHPNLLLRFKLDHNFSHVWTLFEIHACIHLPLSACIHVGVIGTRLHTIHTYNEARYSFFFYMGGRRLSE